MNTEYIREVCDIIGRPVRDRITGITGIATSICFDLYGCTQVAVTPRAKDDGTRGETYWYDYNRLVIEGDGERVMDPPAWLDARTYRTLTPADHGAAEKPAPRG